MIEIIPTVVPGSFADIQASAERASTFAPALHIDITDGIFAPNTTWMPKEGDALPAVQGIAYEVHLMVAQPREMGALFARAGAFRIIGHIEAMHDDVETVFNAWRSAGAREAGLGVLFATPLETLEPYVGLCDVVQMMSIARIGVQGIPYEGGALARIAELHARHPELLIADDGGISEANIAELARAGVSRFCVGSALSKATDPASTYRRLSALAESAIH